MHQPTLKMELKYCERCGGLWLRPWGTPAVDCPSCAEALKLAECVVRPGPLRRGRPSLSRTIDTERSA